MLIEVGFILEFVSFMFVHLREIPTSSQVRVCLITSYWRVLHVVLTTQPRNFVQKKTYSSHQMATGKQSDR